MRVNRNKNDCNNKYFIHFIIFCYRHKVVVVFVLAAIMFVLTNQDELFGDFIEDNTQCPYFGKTFYIFIFFLHFEVIFCELIKIM